MAAVAADHIRGGTKLVENASWYVDNACIMNLDKHPSVQMMPKGKRSKGCIYIYVTHIYIYVTHIYIYYIYPGSPKITFCPLVVRNPLWIILTTIRLAWSQTSRVNLFPSERPLLFCKPASLTKLPGCPTYLKFKYEYQRGVSLLYFNSSTALGRTRHFWPTLIEQHWSKSPEIVWRDFVFGTLVPARLQFFARASQKHL